MINDIDSIRLIESLNLKWAIISEADVDEKPGSTSKMIVRIKNEDGTVKWKYAVYFINIWLRQKGDPKTFVSYPTL